MTEEVKEGAQEPKENLEEDKTLNEEVKFEDSELEFMDDDQSKKVKTLSFQKTRYREKYEMEKAETERLNGLLGDKKEDKPTEKAEETEPAGEAGRMELIELKQDNPDLTREQLQKAQKYAKAEGIETSEMVKSNFFQAYIKTEMEEAGMEGATPNPSSRNGQRELTFDAIIADPKRFRELPKDKRQEFALWKEKNHPEA
jgi:hypothetical protein